MTHARNHGDDLMISLALTMTITMPISLLLAPSIRSASQEQAYRLLIVKIALLLQLH